MNLTNELLELYRVDAVRGSQDVTAANARIVKLCDEVHELTDQLAEVTQRLYTVDPAFRVLFEAAI